MPIVVPYIGTWIETQGSFKAYWGDNVVPYIGTWIETNVNAYQRYLELSRTLYRYVD